MNMPGFTADSSLYRTSGYYYGTAYLEVNSGAILPQQCSLSCLGECFSACTEVGGGPECRANCRVDAAADRLALARGRDAVGVTARRHHLHPAEWARTDGHKISPHYER